MLNFIYRLNLGNCLQINIKIGMVCALLMYGVSIMQDGTWKGGKAWLKAHQTHQRKLKIGMTSEMTSVNSP